MCKRISTINTSAWRSKFYTRKGTTRTPALKSCPQKKGVIYKVTTMSPKKPNSAVRHVAKANLTNEKRITARLPGKGYLCAKYNRVLSHGGRANDLPGVGYSLVRGVYDFSPVLFKKKRRSVYGTERPEGYTTHIKRSLRSFKN